MKLKEVERIRNDYREMAKDKENPDMRIQNIWCTAVDVIACYDLFTYNPVKNIKYGIRMIKKKRLLKRLTEGMHI